MKSNYWSRAAPLLLLIVLGACSAPVVASDRDTLAKMLEEFLAAAHLEAAHERFWADELIYTSSAGARFGKAEIMEGFDTQDAPDEAAVPAVTYSAEEIDIRVFGSTAVVAFRLVGKAQDGSGAERYFNTGTFLKRDGYWSVVAWQATRIPTGPSGD